MDNKEIREIRQQLMLEIEAGDRAKLVLETLNSWLDNYRGLTIELLRLAKGPEALLEVQSRLFAVETLYTELVSQINSAEAAQNEIEVLDAEVEQLDLESGFYNK
jgi:hypothetical protein